MYVVGSSSEVYRFNLEQGRFLAPLISASPGVNCAGVSPYHGLLALGGEDGTLECFDPRSRALAGEAGHTWIGK
jgi:ribosome biogenesis protein ENP2